MNKDIRRWRQMARSSRASVDVEAAAFRVEAGQLRVEIAVVRSEITETMTDLHAWTQALRTGER